MQNHSHYNAIITAPMNAPLSLRIAIRTQDAALAAIAFLPAEVQTKQPDNHIAGQVIKQLTNYFSNAGHRFDLPILAQGTEFQQRVWRQLIKIHANKTCHYGEIAAALGSSARAVGNACRANPIPIVVPCHRVVAKSGLGGYCGKTDGDRLQIKQWLLQHECA